MIATKRQEYFQLEQESSSQLMEFDSRRALGRYEEAAHHALQAGAARARMGRLGFEANEFVEAVEDWLSACECFILAGATQRVADVLADLHQLEREGKFPEERSDLSAALRERDQCFAELTSRNSIIPTVAVTEAKS
jgi:hypothetical protein